MSLRPCKECGKEISSDADRCPHCGKKVDRPSGCFMVILLGLGIIVIGSAFESCNSKSSNTPENIESDTIAGARGACRSAILLTLNDPGSAEFVGLSTDSYAVKQADGTWIVQRQLRAKNAFGAYRLAIFECRVKPNGDGTWRGLSVNQISP